MGSLAKGTIILIVFDSFKLGMHQLQIPAI